jgi:flagellar biosynthesis anti-sigma factor FlgM
MKIEGNGPGQVGTPKETQQSQAAERPAPKGREESAAAAGRSSDRVALSSDAKLMDSAVRALSRAPEVRQDLVERARQKLAAGDLGRDVERLAERMIDHLLSR